MRGKQSITDSGNSLIKICDELSLNKVKEELLQAEGKDVAHGKENLFERLNKHSGRLVKVGNQDEENKATEL